MRGAKMKKLILVIPTTVATVLLVIAFVAPAAASGAVRTVAPALHFATTILPGGGAAVSVQQVSGTKVGVVSAPGQANRSNGTVTGNSTPTGLVANDLSAGADSHSISTTGHENCGRYGSGFHGGKHNFTCPNRPFPVKSHF